MVKIGIVNALYRYPIKSLLGETVRAADFTLTAGMVGDRHFALRDRQTGHLVSAKRPQLWRKALLAGSHLEDEMTIITLPGRGPVCSTDPAASAVLSSFLGREVELVSQRPDGACLERAVPEEVALHDDAANVSFTVIPIAQGAPGGGFVDFAPVHILAQSSLDAVQGYKEAIGSEVRFRPNIFIEDQGHAPFTENDWPGRKLLIGTAEFAIIFPTPRCAVPSLRHGTVQREAGMLRALADANMVDIDGLGRQPCLGAYAQVVVPGRVERGDVAVLR